MMRDILRHADPLWRNQRSTNARLLDPRNQNKMKRRRAGVVHTNWDSLMTRWSGCRRWWESCKGWENFVKAAEELCKRALKREENKGTQGWNRNDEQEEKGEQAKERKNNIMKERNKLRNWDPSWANQIMVQIMGDSNLVVNWKNGRWKINYQKFGAEVQKDAESTGQNRHSSDQHTNRDWNEEADRLTHEAREKGASWNSFTMKKGAKIEAVRACFDGGASRQEDRQVKHKVGSAYVIQTSERIEEAAEKMEWRTVFEVAKVLPW